MSEHSSGRHNPGAYRHARALRRPMTPAEVVLWRSLRAKRFGGFKFRRQQPVGPYVADFFCAAAGLVVELDGDTHVGREDHDARRTVYLESVGLRVIRFWNTEVYENLDGVLSLIFETCTTRAREREASHPHPPPVEGEGRRASGGEGGTTHDGVQ